MRHGDEFTLTRSAKGRLGRVRRVGGSVAEGEGTRQPHCWSLGPWRSSGGSHSSASLFEILLP
eukprot:3594453-Rhodomonas_salina.1